MSGRAWTSRILRWTVTLMAVAWAVLLVGVVVFWIRSAFVTDVVTRTHSYSNSAESGDHSAQLVSARGLLLVQSSDDRVPQGAVGATVRWISGPRDRVGWDVRHMTAASARVFILGYSSNGGFSWRTAPQRYNANYWQQEISAPYWAVVIAMMIPFIIAYPFWRRARGRLNREATGLCVKCGYDLRASRDRCPECGLAFRREELIHEAAKT